MLNVVVNAKALQVNTAESKRALQKALLGSTLLVQNEAKRNAPYLKGNLRRSITHEIKPWGSKIGTDVVYARIQEFGGTIRPKNAEYLTFKLNGRWVRTKKVRIKPQPYLRPALKDKKQEVLTIFSQAIKQLLT